MVRVGRAGLECAGQREGLALGCGLGHTGEQDIHGAQNSVMVRVEYRWEEVRGQVCPEKWRP